MNPRLTGCLFIMLIALAVLPGRTQQPEWLQLVKVFDIETGQFSPDHLGNIYYKTNQGLAKINPSGQDRKHYSNPRFGPITQFDATDPFNIIVFHGGFRHIAWLDRNLAIKEGPALPQVFSGDFPTKVCHSALGGFWAYFPDQNRLRRFNQNFQQQAESLRFYEIFDGGFDPVFMTEANNRLFISDPLKGIAVFDTFGNFLFLIERKDIDRFQVFENLLIYFSDKELIAFDFLLQQENLFLLPVNEIKSGMVIGRQIYLQTRGEIRLYETNQRLF